ncbi:replication protein RepO [Enterobacter kobei]|uniref:replication protein RepO n=1 Tax=Enterobacter kobei TaxID=208224 RepID=UPI0018F3E59E|nr:replication protein RepO [Enterobacter kobei]MDD9222272.1 replication protein RepO [Enterobacter kobei]
MSRLLINEQPLLVLPSLACEIGLNEALVLQQIHYWMNSSKNFFEGRYWVYNSVSEWQTQFPFWSESTTKRALAKLEKLGLVDIGDFNSDAWDKTKWYSINYDTLDKLSGPAKTVTNRLGQNDPIEERKMTKASGQNDQSPQVKMTRSPTENTTENKDLDPPNPQMGEVEEIILAEAKKALEFYNDCTGTRCRDVKPFVLMLTPTKTREGYTLSELQLVIRWVLATWRRRGAGAPKPANICRVSRFDGYLADAEAWATTEASIDPVAVIDGYNEIFADVLPAATLDADRRQKITRLAAHMMNKTTGAFLGYLEKFRNTAPDFYFGGENRDGWRASFDYLMKPETLRKTREGAL